MRILHVLPDLAIASGGVVTAAIGLAEAQAEQGVSVSVASTDFGVERIPTSESLSVDLFPCLLGGWRWAPALGRFLKHRVADYDLVHVHAIWEYPTWAAARACRASGVPYIIEPAGMLDPWSLSQKAWKKRLYLGALGRTALQGASALRGTSDAELADPRVKQWNPSRFVVGLGVSRFTYQNCVREDVFLHRFPALANRRIVLFLGRLTYKKQPEVALRAFHRACRDRDDVALVFSGPSEAGQEQLLRKAASDLGLQDRVVFTGIIHGDLLHAAYRAASVFVLPSLQENFGLAVVEAMAAGCPVIVSDRIDLAPVIREADAGTVVSPNTVDTADAMSKLLSDEPGRVRKGRNARRLVLERFTWERVASGVIEVYRDILRGQKTSSAWRGAPHAAGVSRPS